MFWVVLSVLLAVPEAPQSIEFEHPDCVLSVAFSPDGLSAASCDNAGAIRIWSTSTGRESRVLKGHTKHVASIRFTPDGRHLVSGSYDKTIRIWDMATGDEVWQSAEHGSTVYKVRVSADGRYIASASTKKVILWEAKTRRRVRTFPGADPCAFSPDGRYLAAEIDGSRIALFDVASGDEIRRLSPDPKLAPAGRKQRVASISSLVFTPDGSRLIAGLRGGAVTVHEVATGQQLQQLEGHSQSVRGIAISPDGQLLATGSWDTSVKLWELATGTELLEIGAHTGYVLSVNFSPDGTRLLTGARDKRAILWHIGEWTRGSAPPREGVPSIEELEGWWADLESYNAQSAYVALWELVGSGAQAVRFLASRPEFAAERPEEAEIRRLIRVLDAPSYAARERTMRRLRSYGLAAEAVLEEARAGTASPEVRRRARTLLEEMRSTQAWTQHYLRAIRLIKVLAHIGTPDARDLLRRLARNPSPRIRRAARFALSRLGAQ